MHSKADATTRLRMHFLGRVGFDDSMTAADAVYLGGDLAMRRAFDCVCVAWHTLAFTAFINLGP